MKNNGEQKEMRIASWSNVLPTTTRMVDYKEKQFGNGAWNGRPIIARGSGRSFGDAAYITNGVTLSSQSLRRIEAVDAEQGTVVCQSGVEMGMLHRHLENEGWSFPIYGGTQWVTVGGAVASDIHGKNDVAQGSFGNHVVEIQLIMPDGERLRCSRSTHPDLFAATIGGMGLTGFIEKVKLKLQRRVARMVCMRTRSASSLEEMLDYFTHIQSDFHVYSWINCTAPSSKGLFSYASYTDAGQDRPHGAIQMRLPSINIYSSWSMWIAHTMQHLIYGKRDKLMHVQNFNYIGPHELFKYWNNLFGRAGMIEYQFLVPRVHLQTAISQLLHLCHRHTITVYGAVIKRLGNVVRAGLLSFPQQGYTMSFQIKNQPENRRLLANFTDFLLELDGRIYLAKDSCVLPRQFAQMYAELDHWREIVQRYDPANRVRSDLSIRLGLKPW